MTSNTAYRSPSHPMRWGIVLALHILLGWLLVSGTQISALKALRKPMETLLIQDVALLPPTPPKPTVKAPKPYAPAPEVVVTRQESASSITTVAQSVPEQPMAPSTMVAAPSAVSAPALPEKVEAALICPNQVRPEIPRQALLNNIQGLVQAQAMVQDGQVKEVRILSGPRIFHEAVKTAMRQYQCASQSHPVVAMQNFNFRFE